MNTPDNSQSQTQAFPIREYFQILLHRKLGFMLAVICVVCIGVSYTLQQPKIYQATTTVIINPEPSTVSAIDANDYNQQYYLRDTYYDTQLKIMQSKTVAQRVIDDLGLETDIDFLGLGAIDNPDVVQSRLEKIDAASILLGHLKVEAVVNTRLVNITVRDRKPERAAELANAIASAYSEQNSEVRLASLNKTSDFIKHQNIENEEKLQQARLALNQFQKEHAILYSNPTEQQKITNSRLTALYNKRIEVDTEREKLGFTLAELKPIPPKFENAHTYATILNFNMADLGVENCKNLQKEEQKLLATYQANAPQVVAVHKQIDDCIDATVAAMKSMKDGITARYQALTKLNDDLSSQIRKLQKEALELDQLRLLYEQFETQKAEQERLFEESQRKMNEVSLNRLLDVNNIRILDMATPSKYPVSPNIIMNAILTLMAAMFAGLFVVLLLELLDITVRSQDDIERRARMPFIGAVPKLKYASSLIGREAYRFILEHPHSPVSECIRTIRTTLSFLLPGDQSNILLVTSAQPYDGKTITSLNLAVTSAIAGKKVLLLEADLRRPKLYKALKIKQENGIANLIQGKCSIKDAITHTEIEGLDLMPCGAIPNTPAELFQHDAFPQMLEKLRKSYNVIIIDSPPVTVVSDALIISKYVNGVVVIARANKTPIPALVRTRELLEGVSAPIMGVIINDMKTGSHNYGYGYYYTHEYK